MQKRITAEPIFAHEHKYDRSPRRCGAGATIWNPYKSFRYQLSVRKTECNSRRQLHIHSLPAQLNHFRRYFPFTRSNPSIRVKSFEITQKHAYTPKITTDSRDSIPSLPARVSIHERILMIHTHFYITHGYLFAIYVFHWNWFILFVFIFALSPRSQCLRAASLCKHILHTFRIPFTRENVSASFQMK